MRFVVASHDILYHGFDSETDPNPFGPFVTMFYENGKAILFTDGLLLFSGWKSRYGKIVDEEFIKMFMGREGYYRVPAIVLEVILDALDLSVRRVDGGEIGRDATPEDGFPARMFDWFIATIRSGKCRTISEARVTELFGHSDAYGGCTALALKTRAEREIMDGNFVTPLMLWGGVPIRAIDRLPYEAQRESESRISRCLTARTTKTLPIERQSSRYHPFANAIRQRDM